MATMNYSSDCYTVRLCQASVPSSTYRRQLLDMEKDFDECGNLQWIMDIWKICYVAITLYLVTIFAGQRLMRSRPAFQLRGALLAWNAALAAFSIFSTWRTVTAMLYQIGQVGFYGTLCGSHSKQFQLSMGVHVYFFAFSKFVELGDTAFVVLRKKPLLVVHWFHHATVTFFVWSCGAYPSPIQNYFMTMNYFVHSFVYTYYALKMLKIRLPKAAGMAITSLELFQMLVGLYITLYTYRMRATPGVGCCVVDEANVIALSIYVAYVVLFSNFFVRAYVLMKPSLKATAEKTD